MNTVKIVYVGGASGFVACLDYGEVEIELDNLCFKGLFIDSLRNRYQLAIL